MLIEKSQWSEYFAELTRQAEGYTTSIEIMSGSLGDQVEARETPLHEFAYDPHEGIAVSVGGTTAKFPVILRHVISDPATVETTDEPGVPAALEIVGEDGVRTLVRLTPAR
jgi:Family of unknown function (DUF5335)